MGLIHPDNRKWMLAVVACVLAAVLVAGGLLTAGMVRYFKAADYPGAIVVSAEGAVKVWPYPIVRRTNAYLTTDPFSTVYRWYSNGFALGPDFYALNACVQMANNFTDYYIFERYMSVMLCDSPRGRTILVTRTFSLRLKL